MYKYFTTDKKNWHNLKENARKNRNNQTFSEKIMWNILRNSKFGVQFRRQKIIENYIVDFVCLKLNLIIEVDGDSHVGKEEYDELRQLNLENLGYKILRFTNEELLQNTNKIENILKIEISKLLKEL